MRPNLLVLFWFEKHIGKLFADQILLLPLRVKGDHVSAEIAVGVEANDSFGNPTDLEDRRSKQGRPVGCLAELSVEVLERIELHRSPFRLVLAENKPCVGSTVVRRVRNHASGRGRIPLCVG